MARDYTTTKLVADIKRRSSIPSSQALFTDDDIIEFMDEELHSNLVPIIMTLREEFFVVPHQVAVTAGENTYPIPTRAIGTKLRDVTLQLTSGEVYNIARWSPEMIASRSRRISWDRPNSFYLQGNNLILYPTPASVSTINMNYFRRPGHLISTSEAVQIESIDTNTKEVTFVSAYPTSWSIGTLLDANSSVPPFGHVADSREIIATPSTLTVELDDVSDLSINDWVSLERESPVVGIPEEGVNVLKQMAIVKLLESLGDDKELQTAQAKYTEMVNNFKTLISSRVEGEAKKLVGGTNIQDYVRGWRRRGWW